MKPVALTIYPGAVKVNSAYIYRETDGIVCIEVDMHSKNASLDGTGGSPPTLYLGADENTLHTDPASNDMTIVELPEYEGWEVFSSHTARYTVRIVLVKTL